MLERNYLVTAEVDRLLAATQGSRNAARDRCLLLLMFRHGLRVSEACGLKRSQVDVENRVVHVLRLKGPRRSLTKKASVAGASLSAPPATPWWRALLPGAAGASWTTLSSTG